MTRNIAFDKDGNIIKADNASTFVVPKTTERIIIVAEKIEFGAIRPSVPERSRCPKPGQSRQSFRSECGS